MAEILSYAPRIHATRKEISQRLTIHFPAHAYQPNVGAAQQELDNAWSFYRFICRRSWLEEDNADRYQAAQERIELATFLMKIVREEKGVA